MLRQDHKWDKFWKTAQKGLLTASVIFNILILSFVAGSMARRMGLFGGNKPISAKEKAVSPARSVNCPKRDDKATVISFEQVKSRAELHPQAQRFVADAENKEYSFGWSLSLNYRPADSAFFYLVELAAERCGCEGNPFSKNGLRLFLNPYEGRVFFVDALEDVPLALAGTD